MNTRTAQNVNTKGQVGNTSILVYYRSIDPQELDVDMFSLLVYPLRSRGKDGHFADAQIVSG